MKDTIGTSRQSADWFNGYRRGYRDGEESLISSIKVVSDELDCEADEAVEVLEDRCFCEDCLSENPIVFDRSRSRKRPKHQVREGGSVMPSIKIDGILFEREHSCWVGQWLQYDLGAQAESLEDLVYQMQRAVVGHIAIAVAAGETPFESLKAAPQEYWDQFEKAKLGIDTEDEGGATQQEREGWRVKTDDVMALYWKGYSDALEGKFTSLADLEEIAAETRPAEPAEDEDRCCCEDCLNESGDTSDAEMDEKYGFHIEHVDDDDPVLTGFVVCVNDEPCPDTFSEDASITWQLFLPILEADPGLGNEDVRLVRLVEE